MNIDPGLFLWRRGYFSPIRAGRTQPDARTDRRHFEPCPAGVGLVRHGVLSRQFGGELQHEWLDAAGLKHLFASASGILGSRSDHDVPLH